MRSRHTTRPWIGIRILHFYRDGFRRMTVGRTLWAIIAVKVFLIFAVLKFFFFPDFLATRFATDMQRADHVLQQLTRPAQGSTQPE